MNDRPFYDTNVLLYLLSAEPAKADRVESLLLAGGMVSVQVLNELVSVCRRKLGLSWQEVDTLLEAVRSACSVVPLTPVTFDLGRRLAERYQFSVYDAMIVAAAWEAEARILYSEDMHHSLVVDRRLRITNPFQ